MTKKDGAEWLSVAAVIVVGVATTVVLVTVDSIIGAIKAFEDDDWQNELP